MILGIAEDFTSNISLDTQLTSPSDSGLFLNSGVHPSITLENLLAFLPSEYTVEKDYDSDKTYGKFENTRNKSDLVVYNNKIYQSLVTANTGNQPDTSTNEWLETNIESLRLKHLIFSVLDKAYADLRLTKRLVDSQEIYDIGKHEITLPNDYAAWVFEPKGSDYVTIKINQVAFTKKSTTPVNLYVVNQGVLIDTLQITPSNGIVEFKDLNYTFKGKGSWYFVIDAQDVLVGDYNIDPLSFNGFVVSTAVGTGDSPETAKYSYSTNGNGLGFNISCYLDSSNYIENNIESFGNYVRALFEYVVFQTYYHNSNNQSNRAQRIQMKDEVLLMELKSLQSDTVVRRYNSEKKKAIKQLQLTFDTELDDNDYEIEVTTI
ncbi:hypothetical protein [uncultured Winogradskyella sp.]|uniref:hypothetical protein n=1 Tax=uncultured Winogradskyella sp. TaxID=395353 RepID=UPI00262A7CEC|nr:hypothetical protein [uncultured Winogradskyella sp.]